MPNPSLSKIKLNGVEYELEDAVARAATQISISNTLSSGTLIATINGTNIYAPSYTDADEVSY